MRYNRKKYEFMFFLILMRVFQHFVIFRKSKKVHSISIMRLTALNWARSIRAAPECPRAEGNNHKVADAANIDYFILILHIRKAGNKQYIYQIFTAVAMKCLSI